MRHLDSIGVDRGLTLRLVYYLHFPEFRVKFTSKVIVES